ncbi:MAG: hypothetical protein QXN59_00220 [Candidatus Micrarchaeaceae archaeon]
MKVTNLGRMKFGAAKNMAFDEAMRRMAEFNSKIYMRFYEFEIESVILSVSDDPSCIKPNCSVDLTRRNTGGKPIYIDGNALAYSIAGPIAQIEGGTGPNAVHKTFGKIAEGAIEEIVGNRAEVGLGGVYSININGMPVAGHAQNIDLSRSFLYHGVIAVGKWDADRIRNAIEFPEKDYESISALPALSDYTGIGVEDSKKILIEGMLRRAEAEDPDEEERAEVNRISDELMKEKYSDKAWIYGEGRQLRRGARFCLLYPDA